jgi:hypothetical protein
MDKRQGHCVAQWSSGCLCHSLACSRSCIDATKTLPYATTIHRHIGTQSGELHLLSATKVCRLAASGALIKLAHVSYGHYHAAGSGGGSSLPAEELREAMQPCWSQQPFPGGPVTSLAFAVDGVHFAACSAASGQASHAACGSCDSSVIVSRAMYGIHTVDRHMEYMNTKAGRARASSRTASTCDKGYL